MRSWLAVLGVIAVALWVASPARAMSSWSAFWRSRPALRSERTITSVQTPIVRGTSPFGYEIET